MSNEEKVYGTLTYSMLLRNVSIEPEWAASRMQFDARRIAELEAENARLRDSLFKVSMEAAQLRLDPVLKTLSDETQSYEDLKAARDALAAKLAVLEAEIADAPVVQGNLQGGWVPSGVLPCPFQSHRARLVRVERIETLGTKTELNVSEVSGTKEEK